MAAAGKNLLVKVSTASNGTFTTIGQMTSATMNAAGENFDISAFGASFRSRLQGLKDVSYSLSGFFMSTDASGQTAVRAAWANDTALFTQFMIDGTTNNMFSQEVKVGSYDVDASVDGPVGLSIGLEGTGALTIATTS